MGREKQSSGTKVYEPNKITHFETKLKPPPARVKAGENMKQTMTKPCNACPFLKEFSRGYSLARLQEFALTDFPCHKTCTMEEDNEDHPHYGEYVANENSVMCAGAMIFLAKRKKQYTYGFDDSKLDMKSPVR